MRKSIGQQGIFITFMAFLLVSTVLTLSVLVNQTEIGQGRNLVNEIAFKNVNNRFNNMEQQIMIVKEGYAGETYGRFMPFEKFIVDKNVIEIEQKFPISGKVLEKTYDALNLFTVFAEEKGSEGTNVNIYEVLQNTAWNGEEDYPKISYIVFPQCLKISVGSESIPGMMEFEGGSIASGDPCDFDPNSIEGYEIEIRLDADKFTPPPPLECSGVFNPCGENGDPELKNEPYTKIVLVLDRYTNCPRDGFDAEGKRTISGNLDNIPDIDYIKAVFDSGLSFKLEFDNNKMKIIKNNDEVEIFNSKIIFKEPVEEVVLAPGSFGFSVKNPGFKICRATEEEGCN